MAHASIKPLGDDARQLPAIQLPGLPLSIRVGRNLLFLLESLQSIASFTLITFGVMLTRLNTATRTIHPLIRHQIHRAGTQQLPVLLMLACALGFVVIGQLVAVLSRVGAQGLAGTVMVSVVVRELGPLVTALLVLTRVGTATVIELGTARALGEIEALEALGIDPIHYAVVPRVIGLALSVFALTIYFILASLATGYGVLFVQGVSLGPMDYLGQIAAAIQWIDFVLLFLKTIIFGVVIAVVTCHEGLAHPLRLDEVSSATTRAVVLSLCLCVVVDALFIVALLI